MVIKKGCRSTSINILKNIACNKRSKIVPKTGSNKGKSFEKIFQIYRENSIEVEVVISLKERKLPLQCISAVYTVEEKLFCVLDK